MANTAAKVSASPNHLTYLLTGGGTGGGGEEVGPTVANATILADMVPGPLRDAWNATYADQAAMRTALLGGGADCHVEVQLAVAVNDTTAELNQVSVDVDVDAVTATKAEINISMSFTTGQLAYLHIKHRHSLAQ